MQKRVLLNDLTVGSGPIGNLQWQKEVEEEAGNVLILRMMSWIPWTQALILMLLAVAGMLMNSISVCRVPWKNIALDEAYVQEK